MLNKITNNKVAVILSLTIVCLIGYIAFLKSDEHNSGNVIEEPIVYTDSTKTTHAIFNSDDFKSLKEENRVLYDSLKMLKDEISYLIQFNYSKKYDTGLVKVEPNKDKPAIEALDTLEDKTFEYKNLKANDTLEYTLKINSKVEPNWYRISLKVSERFTILNKTKGEQNETTITTNGKGDVDNLTVFNKREKKKFKDRIGFGPGVTVGYNPFNHNVGIVIGVSVTYNIF